MDKDEAGTASTVQIDMSQDKNIIGRWVYMDIPALNLYGARAKVDTGAYHSSLHCDFVQTTHKDGNSVVQVQMTDLNDRPLGESVTLQQKQTSLIKSSNGSSQERPIVMLDVTINGKQFTSEFSLSDRQDMKFPILLGRKLLRQGFMVDVSLDASHVESDDDDE